MDVHRLFCVGGKQQVKTLSFAFRIMLFVSGMPKINYMLHSNFNFDTFAFVPMPKYPIIYQIFIWDNKTSDFLRMDGDVANKLHTYSFKAPNYDEKECNG